MTNHLELKTNQLKRFCDPKLFSFKSTKNLPPSKSIIGQERAMNAIAFGVDIDSNGYHIYALGPVGTGKMTIVRKFLEKDVKNKPVPSDWLYVNNFDNPDKPKALALPAGKGKGFRDDMDQLVESLRTEVPKAFEEKEYENEQEHIEQEFSRRSKELFAGLAKKAEERGFRLIQTPQGMAVLPVKDDKIMTPEEQDALDEETRKKLEKHQEVLISEIRATLRNIEELQKKGRSHIKELDQRMVGFVVNHILHALKEKYCDYAEILSFLTSAQEHLLKNIQAFKQLRVMEHTQGQQKMALSLMMGNPEPTFEEYRVNLIVDNSATKHAPLVIEKNPTGPNLIGRIEQQGWLGTLVTNFRMIKAGSLHRAIGGYLVIDVYDILRKPFAWEVLKRALKNREIMIESMMEAFGGLMTRTIEPEPIPLKTKVVLIGDPFLYYLLSVYDPEFGELFRVKADFEMQTAWSHDMPKKYAQFIASVCNEEKLLHFTPDGVAKIVERCAREVEHQNKLVTKFGDIVDLVRQASFWAKQAKHKLVTADDVTKALDEKIYRSNRIEQHLQEMIDEGTLLVATDGKQVGQINGLAVLSMGDYAFGRPSRITATTFVGSAGVVNIDREVELAGKIHNKGSMILTGYLGGRYAMNGPLAFSASLVFEQSYDGVDGDSASSTELYALLSSLSGLPLRQDLAVTGSVNQLGEVQPIGGVNEKIEGFFAVCKLKGLTGKQGVMIPKSNAKHLMLRDEVIAAVQKGKFHIYAVTTIDEGIEILTGKPAGKLAKNGSYPVGSVNALVAKRIHELAEKAAEFKNAISKNGNKKAKKH